VDFLESLPFYRYLIGASACLVLIAIILYFVPGGRLKIPAIVSCTLFSFVGGIGVGVIAMYGLGYHWKGPPRTMANGSPLPLGKGGGPAVGGESKKGGGKKAEPDAKGGAEKKGKNGVD